jgi:uncharacterized membrane protein YraQ (UPF0718 family)
LEIFVYHRNWFDDEQSFEDENHKQMHQVQFVPESILNHSKSNTTKQIYQKQKTVCFYTCRKWFNAAAGWLLIGILIISYCRKRRTISTLLNEDNSANNVARRLGSERWRLYSVGVGTCNDRAILNTKN